MWTQTQDMDTDMTLHGDASISKRLGYTCWGFTIFYHYFRIYITQNT